MTLRTNRSVQFTDIDSVIAAYNARGIAAFGVWQGTQFLFKYEGNDISEGANRLATFIDLLQDSAAIYTVSVYEDLNGARINNKTPYEGSFNFRLQQDTVAYNNGSALLREINERLEDIEQARNEPKRDALGEIGEVLQHPVIQQFLPAIMNALGLPLQPGAQIQPAGVAGQLSGIVTPDPDNKQVLECIEVLGRHFDIKATLHRLAVMSSTNPYKFKMIVEAINSFEV